MQLTFVVQTLILSTRSNVTYYQLYKTDVNGRPLNPPSQIRFTKKNGSKKTLWNCLNVVKFYQISWVAIIRGGNWLDEYFSRWEFPGWEISGCQFSGWEFSWVGIVQVGLILRGNFLWWKFSEWELSGGNHPGGNFPGGNFHVTIFTALYL